MLLIVVGECNQNHEDDGQNGEDQNAHNGQGQQGLMELVIKKGFHIILS